MSNVSDITGLGSAELNLNQSTTRQSELERKFNELEIRLAEVRLLATQNVHDVSNDDAPMLEACNDFPDVGASHDPFGDFVDLDLLSHEPISSSSVRLLHTGQPLNNVPLTQWYKDGREARALRRSRQIPSQPSSYDLDLLELHNSVRFKMLRQSMAPDQPQQSLDTLVQRMLYLLASDKYWSGKRTFWFETLAFEKLAPLTRYHILPTIENYWAIPPTFRPTQLQLSRFHWPMIDWIPNAALRDKLMLHAHEVDLTAAWEYIMDCWCLESKVEVPVENGHQEIPVYYRLSEYLEYRSQKASNATSMPSEISKFVEAEFVLALRRQEGSFKLEQSYFDRFPMLFAEDALVKGEYRPIALNKISP